MFHFQRDIFRVLEIIQSKSNTKKENNIETRKIYFWSPFDDRNENVEGTFSGDNLWSASMVLNNSHNKHVNKCYNKNQYIFLVETTYNSSNQDEKQNYTTATNAQAKSKQS